MNKDSNETLLVLYKEKMSYLVAYDKIYSWMLGLLGMGLIAMIGFVLQHNVLQPKGDSSDFYDGEFTPPYSIKGLCDAICGTPLKDSLPKTLNHLLQQLTDPKNCNITSLNKLLKETGLYSALSEKKPPYEESISDNLINLECITTKDGTKNFLNLSATRQATIKKLNRLLLEEKYPDETPKCEAELETTSIIVILIIFGLFPLIINAWFSAYIFCYWYSYLLCQNIEYIEKLIVKDILPLYNDKFATWRNDFFSIFYGKSTGERVGTMLRKLPAYTLFAFIGLPLLTLYGIIFYEVYDPHYFTEVLFFEWKWIVLCIYGLMPFVVLVFTYVASCWRKRSL